MADIAKIPIPEQVKDKLRSLGIEEDKIDNETTVLVALYQQALKGNVSAIDKMQKLLNNTDTTEDKPKDITEEVQKEELKIMQTLDGLTEELKNANKDFIHQLAFQSVTLKNLADDIAKNGVKEKYYNGANQWGYKDRTEVKTYNNMFKNYQSAVKQLNDLILSTGGNLNDDFDTFRRAMTYIEQYYKFLKSNPDKACQKVLSVYKKLVNDLKEPKKVTFFNEITEEQETHTYIFDEQRGRRPIEFIEKFCKHSKGKWSGKPVRLELFQKAFIEALFRIY